MHALLAYADSGDPTLNNLQTVVGAVFIVLATLVLATAVIFISRSRRHRQSESIMVAAFFWACITAGSLIYAGQAQLKWSKEYLVRVESGYYDPNNTADAPKLPWTLWGGLGAAYVGMIWWAVAESVEEKRLNHQDFKHAKVRGWKVTLVFSSTLFGN